MAARSWSSGNVVPARQTVLGWQAWKLHSGNFESTMNERCRFPGGSCYKSISVTAYHIVGIENSSLKDCKERRQWKQQAPKRLYNKHCRENRWQGEHRLLQSRAWHLLRLVPFEKYLRNLFSTLDEILNAPHPYQNTGTAKRNCFRFRGRSFESQSSTQLSQNEQRRQHASLTCSLHLRSWPFCWIFWTAESSSAATQTMLILSWKATDSAVRTVQRSAKLTDSAPLDWAGCNSRWQRTWKTLILIITNHAWNTRIGILYGIDWKSGPLNLTYFLGIELTLDTKLHTYKRSIECRAGVSPNLASKITRIYNVRQWVLY